MLATVVALYKAGLRSPAPLGRDDRSSVVQKGVGAGSRRHDGSHDVCGLGSRYKRYKPER
jgi:hypothetical protein